MKSDCRFPAAGLIVGLLLVFLMAGCGHAFYVSESDAAAYQANLRTASSANNLLSSFQDKLITLQFDSSGQRPRLMSSNIRNLLRGVPNLFVLDTVFRQINLDRLAQQLEQQTDTWVAGRLSGLQQTVGDQVKIERLDRATVQVLSAPTFSYDADHQTISFDGRIKVILSGRIQVTQAGGFDVAVTVDNYRLPGQLQFSNPYVDAASMRLVLSPQPGTVTVASNAPDQVNQGITQVMSKELAVPVNVSRALNYDNFALADLHIAKTQNEPQLSTRYLPAPQCSEPVVDLVARQADGRLYHAQKRAGGWQPFTAIQLPGPVAGDPAVVASGAGRLELAAVSRQGQLVYAAWYEGAWQDVYQASPSGTNNVKFSASRPAIAATAPSQVDVVGRGNDGRLYHARRVNGAWKPVEWVQNAESGAQRPFRDPVAVIGGNQMAVFFLDARNLLYAVVYDTSGETWGAVKQMTTQGVRFAPAAVSCGDGRIDLAYVASNGGARHQVLTFNPAANIVSQVSDNDLSQNLSSSPALACSGYQQLELLGRGTDNRLWHNHLVGVTSPQGVVDGRAIQAGWQGWNPVDDKFFGTAFLGAHVNPPIAIAATRTGEVELLAISRGNGARPLYENTFDSRRFGRTHWTAVHWRGLQELNMSRVVGAPALAVSDRHAELAITWSQVVATPVATLESLIWSTPLGDNNLPSFTQQPNAEVMPGTDPVLVSSGPGSVETFYLSPGGNIEEIRVLNGLAVPTELPTAGTRIGAFSVVGFGSGQIEVVGVAFDHTLHHWRRINGQWTDPQTISGTVISAPILVHVGDGQLDLLAVGGDQRVYHWRFLSGAWTDYHQAPSDFNVSAIAFGPSAASSWGDGQVDVVVVQAGTGKMFHGRTIPLQLGMGFAEIGGRTFDTPSLVALGRQNLGLLALGTDGFLYENWAGPATGGTWTEDDRRFGRDLRWPGFTPMTGIRVFAGPVAHGGGDELTLLVSDFNARVFVNRRRGQMWTGFAALPGQPQEVRAAPRFRPVVEIH